jgi:hypothetical protein
MAAIVYFVTIVLIRVTDDVDIQMARQLIGGVKVHGGRKEA